MDKEFKIELFPNNKRDFVVNSEIDDFNVKDPNSCIPGRYHSFFNRKTIIENNSKEILDDFELIVNGKNYNSVNNIIKSIGMSEDKLENLLRGFKFFNRNIFHATSKFKENKNPLYMINFWGYGLCYDSSDAFGTLLERVNIKYRKIYLNGHSVNEYEVDNKWIILDTNKQIFYLKLDNTSFAGYNDVIDDPFLSLRLKLAGKSYDFSFERSYFNTALFEFIDTEKWQNNYKYKATIKNQELNPLVLFPKEKIIFHYDKIPEKIIGKINVENWRNAKETSLGIVEYIIDVDERKKKSASGKILIQTKYPIYKIIINTTGEIIHIPQDSIVTSFDIIGDIIKGNISVFCQGAKISFPGIKKNKNTAEFITNSKIKDKITVYWKLSPEKQKTKKIEIINKTNKFYYKNPYFILRSVDSVEKIWWQISNKKDFGIIISNFDNIREFSKLIELSKISNTFINGDEIYYFRCKGFKSGVWGEWSDIFSFQVTKPNQPKNVRILPENDGMIRISWDGEFPDKTKFYIFGSNRLDFLPEIYYKISIDEMMNSELINYSENKNLIIITDSNNVCIPDKFSYYRVIAKTQEAFSVPSKLIKFRNYDRKVLQIRHVVEKAPQTKLGYKDFYRAKLVNIFNINKI